MQMGKNGSGINRISPVCPASWLHAGTILVDIRLGACLIGPRGEMMPYIQVGQANLFYLEQGIGDTVVVFGHGTLICSNIWRDFYFPNVPESWRVLAPDFRGHGASNAVISGCNFVRMAEDITQIVKQKQLGKVIYIGLSMGGGVGLQLALNHPEILRGLVLISPVTGLGPLGNPLFLKLGPHMAGKRWLLRLGMRNASTRKPTKQELDAVVEEAMLVSSPTLREYLSPGNRIEGVERISEINIPVLMMVGLKDRVIPVKQQLLLGKAIPNCTLVSHPDFGHALCAENPEWVLGHIQEFVFGLEKI
jgi:pimeloyl-ACP methyl ester carboxylesterase